MKKKSLLNRIKPASAWSLLITALLSGCITEPKFPKEPRISFVSIRKENKPAEREDLVIITIRFEDGDGDLGITAAQAQNDEPWKSGKKNYVLDTYVKRGNNWEEYRDITGEPLDNPSYFFPLIDLTSKPSPIEGTLDYSIPFPQLNPSAPNDTIKFSVFIIDRAQNESNRIETDPIVVYGN